MAHCRHFSYDLSRLLSGSKIEIVHNSEVHSSEVYGKSMKKIY
jgi:hypothetical protein